MALLQIKLPGRQSSNPLTDLQSRAVRATGMTVELIEGIFYRKYPHLRRLKLSNFKSLETLADVMETDLEEAFYYLATKSTMFGVEWEEFILVHPDCVIERIKMKTRRLKKKLRIRESSEEE